VDERLIPACVRMGGVLGAECESWAGSLLQFRRTTWFFNWIGDLIRQILIAHE
jgi:hypothetical protein